MRLHLRVFLNLLEKTARSDRDGDLLTTGCRPNPLYEESQSVKPSNGQTGFGQIRMLLLIERLNGIHQGRCVRSGLQI